MSNHVKTENPDFNVFSVEHLDEAEPFPHIKSEPRVSIINRSHETYRSRLIRFVNIFFENVNQRSRSSVTISIER